MIEGRPASAVNRSLRESPTTQPGTIDIDPGFARLSGASGDVAEFLKGVRKLTSPEGGDMFRGAAVDELNKQRMAAGKAPLDREAALNALLEGDRAPERAAATERLRGRAQGVLSNARASFTRAPIAKRTPTLLESAFKGQYPLPSTGARG